MKTIVEPSVHKNLSARKTRKPQLIANRPTFSRTSERYMKNSAILNLTKTEDMIREEKAIEKKSSMGEIGDSSLNCMLINIDNAVREKPASVSTILS
jgi:hypothetical protein